MRNTPWGFALFSVLIALTVLLQSSCGSNDEMPSPSLSLLGISVNGIPLVDGTVNVATDATFEISFSNAIEASKFAAAFSVSSDAGVVEPLGISYSNASSKAVINMNLEAATSYELLVNADDLGQNDERLAQSIVRNFTTRDDGIITSLPPCITASADCLGSMSIAGDGGISGIMTYYTSYPLELENVRWEELTSAIIVVHGQNRDADNYFSYMINALRQEGVDDQTLLISPYFKSAADAQSGELSWSGSSWREGQNAEGGAAISSFTVLDQIIAMLADEDRFPVLETVIVAGHSSGALFTQAYAAANVTENTYPDLNFHYVVANSQYFYYPDDVRYDSSMDQFTSVSGCPAYNHWPFGYVDAPPYLSTIAEMTVDAQIVERRVAYFLGDQDVVTTGTLNTTDCEAVLLGENRFRRGENIYRLMEANYGSTHQSEKLIVPGVGHNAQGMFQSEVFSNWLKEKI